MFPRKDEGVERREPFKFVLFRSVGFVRVNKLGVVASSLFALSTCSLDLVKTGFSIEQLLEKLALSIVRVSVVRSALDSTVGLASWLGGLVPVSFPESLLLVSSEEEPKRRLDVVFLFVPSRGLLNLLVLVETLVALWLEAAMVEPID